MKTYDSCLWGVLACCMTWTACSDDLIGNSGMVEERTPITLSGEIQQVAVTRVNDEGFCNGDEMGVYIVDYEGNTPGTLQLSGNRGDNVKHTFDEDNYRWNSAYDVYWKDKHTHIDVYGYYPFSNPGSIADYAFTVERDQNRAAEEGTLGGYEASDFLWGKVADVAPTTTKIRLPMNHRMANARVTLVEGNGFAAGEWAQTAKVVLVPNLRRQATINLSDGTVTAAGEVEKTATVPAQVGDEWRAIVVPQTVKGGTTLFSITIGGVPYKFAKEEDFTYTPGKMSNFSIRVDKKEETGDYKLTLISESITAWENDLVSHDATAHEYIIIRSTPGHLKDSLVAAHKDYTKVQNLKVKGSIDTRDFGFMRNDMPHLQAVNLKEARIKGVWTEDNSALDDMIPQDAFSYKRNLTRIVLPDTLVRIGMEAFCWTNIIGPLVIPEGVKEIGYGAFRYCTILTSFTLPTTLEIIGFYAFENCSSLSCELQLPKNLKKIGSGAFVQCSKLSGKLRLPEGVTDLGAGAFGYCFSLSGDDLVIPQAITEIEAGVFEYVSFGGTLQLHDGIVSIGQEAFAGCGFKGELKLPKNLAVLEEGAFQGNGFSGTLNLPETLSNVGRNAFGYNPNLTGILKLPDNLVAIGERAFAGCSGLEGVVFPEGLDIVSERAFEGCTGLNSIVCKGDIPAHADSYSFEGIPKDNFALEVPETALTEYQTAPGWSEFKRIVAHHELVCRPAAACALNAEHRETLIVDAEGEWEVESKPDWCTLSQTSGGNKTEVNLTIQSLAQGAGNRTGEIVFKLKDKEYTHKCVVSQYDYEYGEDEWLTLQEATEGYNGGINIVIFGDGFNAEDIASGDYLKNIRQDVEYFFGVEPYTTYRNYFNVYTAFPLSQERGVGTVNTLVRNRFETTSTYEGLSADYNALFNYALEAPTVNNANRRQMLVIVVPNSTDYGGRTELWEDGSTIAFCPMSRYTYPNDSRGIIQHEAGGHGFGKLGDENICENTFILDWQANLIRRLKSYGWYDNLSVTGKMHEVPWSHLIYDDRYSDIVDVFEGGYGYSRGVFRSEQNSCMNNHIPYFNTISRESIVRRIMQYAGEPYSFEDFVARDNRNAGAVTRASGVTDYRTAGKHQAPTIHKGSPFDKLKKK